MQPGTPAPGTGIPEFNEPQRGDGGGLHASGIAGLDEIENLGLHTLHDRISEKGAGMQNLNPDELTPLVELGSNIWTHFDAVRLLFF